MKASIVIPVLYDEPQLATTLSRLTSLRGGDELEILMIVDVPDPSRETASRAVNDSVASRVAAAVHYRVGRRGFGSALRYGFAQASGDAVIPFMGDACDDAEDIPRLLAKVSEGWDIVAGSRYMPGGRIVGNTPKQRMSRLYGWLVRMAGGLPIHDVSNAFKAYASSVVRAVHTVAESYDISVELTVKAHRAGFRLTEIPTTWTNRELGESNWRFTRELRRYSRWLLLAVRARPRGSRRAPTPVPIPRSTEGS